MGNCRSCLRNTKTLGRGMYSQNVVQVCSEDPFGSQVNSNVQSVGFPESAFSVSSYYTSDDHGSISAMKYPHSVHPPHSFNASTNVSRDRFSTFNQSEEIQHISEREPESTNETRLCFLLFRCLFCAGSLCLFFFIYLLFTWSRHNVVRWQLSLGYFQC